LVLRDKNGNMNDEYWVTDIKMMIF
jgi:hypothetical protein